MNSLELCYSASGIFFMVGLLSGIWKYFGILKSPEAIAPEYVSVLHRASLMYSFATMLLAHFVELNPYSESVKFWSAFSVISFFAFAQSTYLIHALLKDTDNQFRKPYKLGVFNLPPFMIHFSMVLLILCELIGFFILFWGYFEMVIL